MGETAQCALLFRIIIYIGTAVIFADFLHHTSGKMKNVSCPEASPSSNSGGMGTLSGKSVILIIKFDILMSPNLPPPPTSHFCSPDSAYVAYAIFGLLFHMETGFRSALLYFIQKWPPSRNNGKHLFCPTFMPTPAHDNIFDLLLTKMWIMLQGIDCRLVEVNGLCVVPEISNPGGGGESPPTRF